MIRIIAQGTRRFENSLPFHSQRMMGMHLCMVEKISKHIVPICVQSICLIAENLQQSYHTCSP